MRAYSLPSGVLDEVLHLQLCASALPRRLELLFHESSVVVLALGFEYLLQPEKRSRITRVAI